MKAVLNKCVLRANLKIMLIEEHDLTSTGGLFHSFGPAFIKERPLYWEKTLGSWRYMDWLKFVYLNITLR